MDNMSVQPLSVRVAPSLSSLPREILTAITLLLDCPSALTFALTSQAISACSEQRLWRDLDLSLQPHFGELPDIPPNQFADWTLTASENAEAMRCMAIKDKVKAVMNAANRRRWGMVERVRLELRPGATNGFIQLLDNVPNIKALEIDACPPSRYANVIVPDQECLDVRFIASGIFFPSLTKIRIGQLALHFAEFIPLICNKSPSLTSLNVDLTGGLSNIEEDQVGGPSFPPFERDTQIRQLRLPLPDSEDRSEAVNDILLHTPHLQQFILDYASADDEVCRVADALLKLVHLRDLKWNIDALDFWHAVQNSGHPEDGYFPGLQRLILEYTIWHDVFESLHAFAQLKAIYFDKSLEPTLQLPNLSSFPETNLVEGMVPKLVGHLEDCPLLGIIHIIRDCDKSRDFDVFRHTAMIEAQNAADGRIRSIQHGGSETLFHARYLLNYIEISDSADCDEVGRLFRDPTGFRYDKTGGKRIKRFARCATASWHDYTDYNGRVVPLRVISTMREAEGATVGDWEGRGIEVGAVAWKVLTDWEAAEIIKENE